MRSGWREAKKKEDRGQREREKKNSLNPTEKQNTFAIFLPSRSFERAPFLQLLTHSPLPTPLFFSSGGQEGKGLSQKQGTGQAIYEGSWVRDTHSVASQTF